MDVEGNAQLMRREGVTDESPSWYESAPRSVRQDLEICHLRSFDLKTRFLIDSGIYVAYLGIFLAFFVSFCH